MTAIKTAVLGGSGLVGAALLAALRAQSIETVGYESSTLDLNGAGAADRLAEIFDERTVVFMAARSRRCADRFQAFAQDVGAALTVARAVSMRRLRKVVYFSTLSVYGDAATNRAITEDTPLAPTSLYGIAKVAGEAAMRQIAGESGTPLVVVRPCKVYGPGDHSHTYGPVQFVEQILGDGVVRLFGDGAELRDYVYVDDLVAVVIQLGLSHQSGPFNVGTGQSHSFIEIVGILRGIAREPFDVIHLPRGRPTIDQVLDPRRLIAALPDLRFTSLEAGLTATYRYHSTPTVFNVHG